MVDQAKSAGEDGNQAKRTGTAPEEEQQQQPQQQQKQRQQQRPGPQDKTRRDTERRGTDLLCLLAQP